MEDKSKKVILTLMISLFLISSGGLLLHLRVHPLMVKVQPVAQTLQPQKQVKQQNTSPVTPEKEEYKLSKNHLIPFVAGLLSLILITVLFSSKQTASYGYLFNGMTVLIGTITMAHFSLVTRKPELSIQGLLLNTTLADISILAGKFFIGKSIFNLYYGEMQKNTFRYLKLGWWVIHLLFMAVVFELVYFLWK